MCVRACVCMCGFVWNETETIIAVILQGKKMRCEANKGSDDG